MYDITPIFEAVAALIAALITAFVIPYIKSKTTAEQQKEINAWVKIAVAAAEQIYVGSGRGEEKKAYVIDWLRSHGITVDEEKLDALIEVQIRIVVSAEPAVLIPFSRFVQSLHHIRVVPFGLALQTFIHLFRSRDMV